VIGAIRLRLRSLVRGAALDRELDEELRFHLERQIALLMANGLTAERARLDALRALGGIEQQKESCRDARRVAVAEHIARDIRHALRLLRRSPGFSFVAATTLAAGVGATAAIFSVVNAVLLRPLPFREPERLVAVLDRRATDAGWQYGSLARFDEWVKRNPAFSHLAALHGAFYTMDDHGAPRRLPATAVTADFFPMLGVQPLVGRTFRADENRNANARVLLLSYGFWQRQFAGDPSIVGRTIGQAAGQPAYTIIGVLPREFLFAAQDVAVWLPLQNDPASPYRERHEWLIFGRIRDGVSFEQASDRMIGVARDLARDSPSSNDGWSVRLEPMQTFYADRTNTRTALLVLLGAVGVLLLIACANIANLTLARATTRRTEIGVRLALGASRSRIAQQLVTESLVLGAIGGAAGVLIARVVLASLLAIAPVLPAFRPDAVRIDGTSIAVAVVLSLLSSGGSGLAAVPRGSRRAVHAALREAGRGAADGASALATQRWLIAGEMALAVMLVACAGLLVESFWNLRGDRLGLEPSRLLTMNVCCLNRTTYPTQAELNRFHRRALEHVRAIPGVEAASDVSGNTAFPMRQLAGTGSALVVRDWTPPLPGSEPAADLVFAEAEYFHTLQIPIVQGRSFTARDDERSGPVAIVSVSLAHTLWPGGDPIGRQLRPQAGDGADRWHTVVGVAADVKQRGPGRESIPVIYLPVLQEPIGYIAFFVRTRVEPMSIAGPVAQAIASVDGDLPVESVAPVDRALVTAVSTQRFSMILVALFAGFALVLAMIGVYGVTAYAVARRTREIGVRVALGARPSDVVRLVVGEGMRFGLAGVTAGVVGALVLARLMAALLYGVGTGDPRLWSAVALTLLAVTAVACYLPARRALRVDPMVVLRCD
jgi:putative ABC transport system permease protein